MAQSSKIIEANKLLVGLNCLNLNKLNKFMENVLKTMKHFDRGSSRWVSSLCPRPELFWLFGGAFLQLLPNPCST